MNRQLLLDTAIAEIRRMPISLLKNSSEELFYWLSLREVHGLTWKFRNNKREGLYLSQNMNEFSRYLTYLAKMARCRNAPCNYLEIGVFNAGTWVVTTEILRKFGDWFSVGVDIKCSEMARLYSQKPKNAFIQGSTQGAAFANLLRQVSVFDLVLIDGDHSYEGCKRDLEKVQNYSNVVVLHDIVGEAFPGVRQVWDEFRTQTKQFSSHEIICVDKKTRLGIGVAERKQWLKT